MFVEIPRGRRPIGIPRRRWEDNITRIEKKKKLSRYMPWRHMGGKGGIAPTHS
jgi:hypothetical protein